MAVFCILKIIALVFLTKVSAFQIQQVYRTCQGIPPYQYPPQEYYPPPRYVKQSYPPAPSPPSTSNSYLPPIASTPSSSSNTSPSIAKPLPEEPQITPNFNSTILKALNSNLKNGTIGKLDSGVLNNLAIALQLLIVSNLLNSSPEIAKTNSTLALANEIQSYQPLLPYESPPKSLATFPDAHFLGTSTIADSGGMSIYSGPCVPASSPHVTRHIKSPYEAIATPISPFDRYATDFKSPYQAMMSQDTYGDDLFSF